MTEKRYVQLVGLNTIVKKEVHRIFRIWSQTLLPSVITVTLYFLIFGSFIGSRIGELDGYSYIEFIVPGLIMMAVITNSYTNVVSSFFSAKFQKNIEELLVSPLKSNTILIGFLAGGIIRGLMVGLLVTAVSLFFAPMEIYSITLVLAIILFTSTFFSLCGFINAVFARKFDDIAIVPTFVLTPLIYLGGVFYSIHFLPPVWQKVSLFNPILYLVNIFRYAVLGISDIPVFTSLIILVILTLILWLFSAWLLKKGIGIRH